MRLRFSTLENAVWSPLFWESRITECWILTFPKISLPRLNKIPPRALLIKVLFKMSRFGDVCPLMLFPLMRQNTSTERSVKAVLSGGRYNLSKPKNEIYVMVECRILNGNFCFCSCCSWVFNKKKVYVECPILEAFFPFKLCFPRGRNYTVLSRDLLETNARFNVFWVTSESLAQP